MIVALLRRRLHVPDLEDVQNPTRPSSGGTIQVGAVTPVPDLGNVVDATYFSSLMVMIIRVGTGRPVL